MRRKPQYRLSVTDIPSVLSNAVLLDLWILEGNVTLSTKIKTLNNFETIYQFTAEQKQFGPLHKSKCKMLHAFTFYVL